VCIIHILSRERDQTCVEQILGASPCAQHIRCVPHKQRVSVRPPGNELLIGTMKAALSSLSTRHIWTPPCHHTDSEENTPERGRGKSVTHQIRFWMDAYIVSLEIRLYIESRHCATSNKSDLIDDNRPADLIETCAL